MVQAIERTRTASPERWRAALQRALVGGVEVFRIAGSGELVATSATQLDTVYRVDAMHCECAAAVAGDAVCTHRAAARAVLGLLALPEIESCPTCSGGGIIVYRSGNQERCPACHGTGVTPDHRLAGQPSVGIVAEVAA